MKKSLKILPFLFLGGYLAFVYSNERISFLIKIIILIIILIISSIVLYKEIKSKKISKVNIVILGIFILLTISSSVYFYLI